MKTHLCAPTRRTLSAKVPFTVFTKRPLIFEVSRRRPAERDERNVHTGRGVKRRCHSTVRHDRGPSRTRSRRVVSRWHGRPRENDARSRHGRRRSEERARRDVRPAVAAARTFCHRSVRTCPRARGRRCGRRKFMFASFPDTSGSPRRHRRPLPVPRSSVLKIGRRVSLPVRAASSSSSSPSAGGVRVGTRRRARVCSVRFRLVADRSRPTCADHVFGGSRPPGPEGRGNVVTSTGTSYGSIRSDEFARVPCLAQNARAVCILFVRRLLYSIVGEYVSL